MAFTKFTMCFRQPIRTAYMAMYKLVSDEIGSALTCGYSKWTSSERFERN